MADKNKGSGDGKTPQESPKPAPRPTPPPIENFIKGKYTENRDLRESRGEQRGSRPGESR